LCFFLDFLLVLGLRLRMRLFLSNVRVVDLGIDSPVVCIGGFPNKMDEFLLFIKEKKEPYILEIDYETIHPFHQNEIPCIKRRTTVSVAQ
jgi:hypothetical protein